MKKSRPLKDFTWTVFINERAVGFPNFYWEASCEKYRMIGQVVYKSPKNARDGWKELALSEGIKNFEFA